MPPSTTPRAFHQNSPSQSSHHSPLTEDHAPKNPDRLSRAPPGEAGPALPRIQARNHDIRAPEEMPDTRAQHPAVSHPKAQARNHHPFPETANTAPSHRPAPTRRSYIRPQSLLPHAPALSQPPRATAKNPPAPAGRHFTEDGSLPQWRLSCPGWEIPTPEHQSPRRPLLLEGAARAVRLARWAQLCAAW